MGLPKNVNIYEVGPREGFQIEDGPISTSQKVSFVNELNHTGVSSIEVASFVSPKWVPKMADAEEVLSQIDRKKNISYRGMYLNIKGLQRALASGLTIDGVLLLTASHTFSKKNTNKDIKETIQQLPQWINVYKENNISVNQLALMATFGCNYEGNISLNHAKAILRTAKSIAEEHGETITEIKLADTMGWANPEQIKRAVVSMKDEWPDIEILLHLHDTRGLGLANANAAIKEGVRNFETAVGGLGGCPFAAVKGASGNISTEDLVFMCEEMGIETGIDLEKLLTCVQLAEDIVGHKLPGHLLTGGLFSNTRKQTWANQVINH